MIIAMNVWLAFNVMFDLWTSRNLFVRLYAILAGRKFLQNDLGKIIDLLVISSIIAYVLTVKGITF